MFSFRSGSPLVPFAIRGVLSECAIPCTQICNPLKVSPLRAIAWELAQPHHMADSNIWVGDGHTLTPPHHDAGSGLKPGHPGQKVDILPPTFDWATPTVGCGGRAFRNPGTTRWGQEELVAPLTLLAAVNAQGWRNGALGMRQWHVPQA